MFFRFKVTFHFLKFYKITLHKVKLLKHFIEDTQDSAAFQDAAPSKRGRLDCHAGTMWHAALDIGHTIRNYKQFVIIVMVETYTTSHGCAKL